MCGPNRVVEIHMSLLVRVKNIEKDLRRREKVWEFFSMTSDQFLKTSDRFSNDHSDQLYVPLNQYLMTSDQLHLTSDQFDKDDDQNC